MTEYIKKEDAIEALMCYFIPMVCTGEQVDRAKNMAESILNGVPTEEIVRCKDCKYWYKDPLCACDKQISMTGSGTYTSVDFCSKGDRNGK